MIDHNTLVLIAISCMVWLAWLARMRTCTCEKCAFHQNEARVERLRKAERDHDRQHKGDNFGGSPDRFDCSDIHCPRNKMNRVD